MFAEYDQYDGLGLAELVRKKEVSAEELVTTAIERIEASNPQINAVVHKMYDQALQAARGELADGPFRGVPFLLKDLVAFYYAGEPLRCGCRALRNFVPDRDSEIVARFKKAGVIVVGKSSTSEFGLAPLTEPEFGGNTNNPWDLSRTVGGSSGGSGAAVAARWVPIAGGGDGGGSIRIPSSCCGVFGLKPTRGRNPTGPQESEMWQGFSCEHVLTRSVRDSAAMLDATAGPDVGAPYWVAPPQRPFLEEVSTAPGKLKIAFTTTPFLGESVHGDCVRGVESTVELLRELGHEVIEDEPKFDGQAFARAYLRIVSCEAAAFIKEIEVLTKQKARFSDFEASTWGLGLIGSLFPAPEFVQYRQYLQRTARKIGEFFENYDLLLTPTLAQPPIPHKIHQPKGAEEFLLKLFGRFRARRVLKVGGMLEKIAQRIFGFIPYTPIFNVTGQPAMSVPLHWNDEGLPIGMHFVGRFADEATLFRLAGQLEQARPWANKIPSTK